VNASNPSVLLLGSTQYIGVPVFLLGSYLIGSNKDDRTLLRDA